MVIFSRIFPAELIMMDDDFGYDDTVGKNEIDLDGLLLNEKMTTKIDINEVNCMNKYLNRRFDSRQRL
jgi:hypothetical protein